VAEAGVELSPKSSGNTQVSPESGAESGALSGSFALAVREAAHAWTALTADAKRAMRAIVRVTAKSIAPGTET
jgi:hypothetical protein